MQRGTCKLIRSGSRGCVDRRRLQRPRTARPPKRAARRCRKMAPVQPGVSAQMKKLRLCPNQRSGPNVKPLVQSAHQRGFPVWAHSRTAAGRPSSLSSCNETVPFCRIEPPFGAIFRTHEAQLLRRALRRVSRLFKMSPHIRAHWRPCPRSRRSVMVQSFT